MIGHLGVRVSALLDGQLAPEEEERAWEHVHQCHQCRDLVEREGWVKTRLAGLCFDNDAQAPSHLKGSLMSGLSGISLAGIPPGDAYLVGRSSDSPARRFGLVALGGGAAGAAVMGVLALGAAPADAPTIDRRAPATSVTNQVPTGFGFQRQRDVPLP